MKNKLLFAALVCASVIVSSCQGKYEKVVAMRCFKAPCPVYVYSCVRVGRVEKCELLYITYQSRQLPKGSK